MLLLYRSASRSGGCYFDSKAATDFYKAAEYYHTQPEFHGGVAVTEELNVAVVEKEVEAAAVPTVVHGGPPPLGNNENGGGGGGGGMFSDEFMMPPDYLVSSLATRGGRQSRRAIAEKAALEPASWR